MKRKHWISEKTREITEQRKQIKIGPPDQTAYRTLFKNIKKIRKDKEKRVSNICQEVHTAPKWN